MTLQNKAQIYDNQVRLITESTSVLPSDVIINCDTTANPIIIDLLEIPTNFNLDYRLYVVDYSGNSETNNIIINAPAGHLINGEPQIILNKNYSNLIIRFVEQAQYSATGETSLFLEDLKNISIFSPGPSEGDVLYYDGVSWIASPGPALITGDGIGSISTKDNSNSATGEYSAVLGGQNNIMDLDGAGAYGSNITAVDDDTFHVNNLNIYDPPQVDTTNFSVLVRGANGAIGQRFIGGLFAQTASSAPVANTVTPTTIVGTGVGTLSVPENGFNIGDSFVAQIGGIISTGNGQTIQIRVLGGAGSTLLADTGVISLPNGLTNRPWDLYITFTVRALGAATTASIVSSGIFSYASANDLLGADFNTINDTTFNTTINNELDIEVTWGASNASNSITTTQFVLTKIF